jgi:ComF family protein
MSILEKLKNLILDILFPPICLNCKADLQESEKENKICKKCLDSITINSSFFCAKCGARFPNDKKTCHKEMKFILASATSYQNNSAKNIIKFLKYAKWKSLVNIIKPIIDEYINNLNYSIDWRSNEFIALPIPLHRDRLRERGFNQSDLIAEIFCQKTGVIFKNDNLKRIKATKIQAESRNAEERKENIKNCFELVRPEEIRNKNIVLIDDVFTTGSTISETAEVLKKAGARKIIAFVFAKT